MQVGTIFRLSFYTTLALACACLAEAEMFFLPWFIFGCLPLTLLVFALAWRHEGRWIIGDAASNYLGMLIFLGILAWIIWQMPRSDEDLVAGGVSWPAGLLPHLGLLLLLLLVVKLFRPKTAGDFWVIQTQGVMIVTLGCVLAGDPWFTGLMLLYVVNLVWCLSLFHLYRAGRPTEREPLFAPAGAGEPCLQMPWRAYGVGRALLWSLAILLATAPLFLALPRNSSSQWEPQRLSSTASKTLAVGVDTGMNLDRVGTIELSPDPAFHVEVTDRDGRPASLPGNQLWQVVVLDFFREPGQWMSYGQAQGLINPPATPSGIGAKTLPGVGKGATPGMPAAADGGKPAPAPPGTVPGRSLPGAGDVGISAPPLPQIAGEKFEGPKPASPWGPLVVHDRSRAPRPVEPILPPARESQHMVRFTVRPTKAGGLPVAEPLDIRHVGLEALIGDRTPPMEMFHEVPDGDAVMGYVPDRRAQYRYGQIIDTAERGPRMAARSYTPEYRKHIFHPMSHVPTAVRDWAHRQLAVLPSLDAEQRQLDSNGRVLVQHHRAVGEAFCVLLNSSGEYTYTLNLRRQTRDLDPTADFLINVKAGHCERFAGALALALRSLGIPARVVKGYSGAIEEGPGHYMIRLDQAHSWVQVLVFEADRPFWLTLDPTPGQGETKNPLATWFAWLADLEAEQLWRRFVLNYSGDTQVTALSYIWQSLWHDPSKRPLLWQVPCAGAGMVFMWIGWRGRSRLRWVMRRQHRPNLARRPDFYSRLLQVLARRLRLRPQPGQTPLELAACAAALLAQRPAAAAWASLPAQAAQMLYRIRFAGHVLGPDEEAALSEQLVALDAALAQSNR
jgi:hypothetical protein